MVPATQDCQPDCVPRLRLEDQREHHAAQFVLSSEPCIQTGTAWSGARKVKDTDARERAKALVSLGDADLTPLSELLDAANFILPEHGGKARAWCLERATVGRAEHCYAAAAFLYFGLFGPVDEGH